MMRTSKETFLDVLLYVSSKSRYHSFYIVGVTEGRSEGGAEFVDQNKPGLNRAKFIHAQNAPAKLRRRHHMNCNKGNIPDTVSVQKIGQVLTINSSV